MSEPREVFVLDEYALIHAAKVVVQCGTQIGPADDEHPDGVLCGNVIESELVNIPASEPDMAAEFGVECPKCSAILTQREGRPLQAVIPLAVLAGEQVRAMLEPVEPDENNPDEEYDDEEEPDDEQEDPEELPVVEVTPDDQGA